jgi:ATP-dependent DNA helicase RecG
LTAPLLQNQRITKNVAEVQIIGKIINIKTVEFAKGRKRLVATFVDETGQMELVWFQGQNGSGIVEAQ